MCSGCWVRTDGHLSQFHARQQFSHPGSNGTHCDVVPRTLENGFGLLPLPQFLPTDISSSTSCCHSISVIISINSREKTQTVLKQPLGPLLLGNLARGHPPILSIPEHHAKNRTTPSGRSSSPASSDLHSPHAHLLHPQAALSPPWDFLSNRFRPPPVSASRHHQSCFKPPSLPWLRALTLTWIH